jgi:hypothetical protein
LAELSSAECDPFATVVYSSGVTIDLQAPDEELVRQYFSLVKREGRMAGGGLTCQLKADGQDCRTCPSATLEEDEKRSRLCRLGKDQRLLEGLIEDRMDAEAARLAPLRELAEMVGEMGELGEIPDDLSELLTSVGL